LTAIGQLAAASQLHSFMLENRPLVKRPVGGAGCGKEVVARIVEKNYNSFAVLCVQPWRTKGGKEPGHWDSVERDAGVA